MRLTLRTLLAYMDEILEPGDREELAKKIETSDFANDLILRTKDTMRRLRLSAPQVVGTGMALDPNTVAEYLDNVLPPDAVADFERICLESDVHLAEVASAHHVLTMVLGEPADVDARVRQRMYTLPAEAERRKQLRAATPPATPPPAEVGVPVPPRMTPAASTFAPTSERHALEIPDYLRAGAWSGTRLALGALAAALLIAIGAMFVFGLRGWQSEPLAMNAGATKNNSEATPPPIANETETPPAAESAVESAPENAVDTGAANGLAAAPPALALPAMPGTEEPEPSIEVDSTPDAEIAVVEESNAAVENGIEERHPAAGAEEFDPYAVDRGTANAVLGSSDATAPSQASTEITPPPPTMATTVPSGASNSTAADDTPRVASNNVGPTAGMDTISSPLPPSDIDEEPAEKNPELGSYLEGRNILLRYDPTEQAWFRMPPRTTLLPGERLLAVPAFHPKLTLVSGFYIKLDGGTLVSLLHDDASATPELDVAFGRVVIVNTTNNENPIRLRLAATTSEVRLLPNSTLAIDVVPSYVPGQDPRETRPTTTTTLYARDGGVVWQDDVGSETIEAPRSWSITDEIVSAKNPEPTFPDWIDHEVVEQRSEQLYGAPAVEAALDSNRPAEQQLLELYQRSRRREVKSLAARSSVYVGQFVPFVEALRDSDQKSTWKTHIETLRSAMALGPDSADKVWETLVEQRGEEAAGDLYEMLCGYSHEEIGQTPDEVKSGAIAKLIDRLENDSLDYRVLATQNLWEITGMRLMPNPAGSPAERARGVRIWRERLNSGEVTPVAENQ